MKNKITRKEFFKLSPLMICAGLVYLFSNKPKRVPDRFLRRKNDPEYQYITEKRLNDEFKMLEYRVNNLEAK